MGCCSNLTQKQELNLSAFEEPLKMTKEASKRSEDSTKRSTKGTDMEDKILEQESDEKMTFRWLTRRDYSKGFPAVLSGLTVGT